MIAYNMRYRGPIEYDKICLNTLQFWNEVQGMTHYELSNQQKSITNLDNTLSQYVQFFDQNIVQPYYSIILQMS